MERRRSAGLLMSWMNGLVRRSVLRRGIIAASWCCLVVLGVTCAAGSVSVQAATLVAGEASALPGQTQVAFPISLSVATGEQLSALTFDLHFDPLLAQWDSVALEPPIAALGKQVQTSVVAPGHIRLILYGLDRQTFSSGTIAQCMIRIPSSATVGSSLVDLSNGVGSDPNGADLSLALSGGRLWITTPPPDPSPPTALILSPSAGSTVTGTAVTINFSVQNTTVSLGSTHLALSLDGGNVLPLFSLSPYNWANLQPGPHAITLQLVDANGQPLPNPEATATATFTLQSSTTSAVSLTVASPQPNSAITGASVKVQVAVKGMQVRIGTGFAHLHYRIDGGPVSHVYNTNAFWFVNVKPGTHTIGVMLADNATHARIAGTEYQSITITVAP